MVHGDDVPCSRSVHALQRLKKKLSEAFEIKCSIIGAAAHLEKEGKPLNTIVIITASGWEVEGDQRHRGLIVEEVQLNNANGLSTPGVDEPLKDDDEVLEDWEAVRNGSLPARANDLSLDRSDLLFAVKELCKSMSNPTEGSWRKLVRVAKYLISKTRLVLIFDWQEPMQVITTRSDANWPGCLQSQESTSGVLVMIGSHLINK